MRYWATHDRAPSRPHHRHHRPGRLVPRRAPAGQGLRGPRPDPAEQPVQHRPDRPPVRRSAPGTDPALPPLRGPDRQLVAHRAPAPDQARRGLQPRRPEPRQGQLRDAGVHRGDRRDGHAPAARGDPHGELAGPVLPGGQLRDVRQGPGAPQDESTPFNPRSPVRRGQGVRPPHHGRLPRGVRDARLQRDPVQPRVAAPGRHVRDPQGDPRGRRDPQGRERAPVPRQPRRAPRLGLRARSTSRRCG